MNGLEVEYSTIWLLIKSRPSLSINCDVIVICSFERDCTRHTQVVPSICLDKLTFYRYLVAKEGVEPICHCYIQLCSLGEIVSMGI